MPDEGRPEHEFVRDGERQREVHPQVDQPPGVPGQPPPDRAQRDHPDEAHDAERDRGDQHVRVGHQRARLVPEPSPGGLRVAHGEEQRVRGQQADRPRGERPVQPDQAVLAGHPLDGRDPADQQDHDQRQVGAGHAGQAAHEGGQAAGRGQLAGRLGGEGQRGGDAQAEPGGQQRDPGQRGVRLRGRQAGRLLLPVAALRCLRGTEGSRRSTHSGLPCQQAFFAISLNALHFFCIRRLGG